MKWKIISTNTFTFFFLLKLIFYTFFVIHLFNIITIILIWQVKSTRAQRRHLFISHDKLHTSPRIHTCFLFPMYYIYKIILLVGNWDIIHWKLSSFVRNVIMSYYPLLPARFFNIYFKMHSDVWWFCPQIYKLWLYR